MGSKSSSEGPRSFEDLDAAEFEFTMILRIVQTVDRWYVQIQNLARSTGLLGSGRESVGEVEEDGHRFAAFPDLSDEGWPEFRMMLPPEAVLSHTTAGVFYRGAHYRSDLIREELVVRYKAGLADAGLHYESVDDPTEDFLRTRDLGGDVRIRIARARGSGTAISIGQYRDPSIVDAAIDRVARRMRSSSDSETEAR